MVVVAYEEYSEHLPTLLMMNTTTSQPMKDVSLGVGPQAQLMLLQLLTQVKSLQQTCKPNNETSPGEEALRTLARDAIEREQNTKRQLETLERTSKETVINLTAELNYTMQQLNVAQELNKNLSVFLKNKEDEMQELQQKLQGLENSRAKKLQEVLNGRTKEEALIKAAKRGNTEEMSIIMDDGTMNLQYSDDTRQWTALEWTVAFGHTQACRLLLERGANPNRYKALATRQEHWPLRVAARFGQLEIASLLLQYDAEMPNTEMTMYTDYNDDPDKIASARGFLELAQMLCEWKDGAHCSYLTNRH